MVSGLRKACYGVNLRWEGDCPIFGDAVSEEVDTRQPKLALGWVDYEPMLTESVEKGPEMGQMLCLGGTGDQDVI